MELKLQLVMEPIMYSLPQRHQEGHKEAHFQVKEKAL